MPEIEEVAVVSRPHQHHTPENNHFVLRVNHRKIVRGAIFIAVALLLLNLTGILLAEILMIESWIVNALVYYFDAAREQSVPTLFSSLLLFVASVLLFIIFLIREKKKHRNAWFILGAVFLFLLLDESTAIHEQFNRLRPIMGDETGYLYYTWIVPYAIFLVIFAIVMCRFVFSLPAITRNTMILSGVVYVSAALGFEIFEGVSSKAEGAGNLQDRLLTAGEEFLEMIGVTIFIKSLFGYMENFNLSFKLARTKS